MADDGSTQGATWPMPKFRFSVNWNSQTINCQEVTGLEAETQIIEYRHSNSPVYSTIKMPGIAKYGNVTIKKGVFVNDNQFWNWYNQIKMNTILRSTIVIQLLDEAGAPVTTWKLMNAWPVKVSGTDLKSDGNEVAIESIEIAHEGLVIGNGK